MFILLQLDNSWISAKITNNKMQSIKKFFLQSHTPIWWFGFRF